MAAYDFSENKERIRIDELPDPFMKPDGSRIKDISEWETQRTYLKEMISHYVYGSLPELPDEVTGEIIHTETLYDNKAILEKVKVTTSNGITFMVDTIRPNVNEKVPVIVWSNYRSTYGPCPIEEEIVTKRHYAISSFERGALVCEMGNIFDTKLGKAYPDCNWGQLAMWAFGHMLTASYLETTDYADLEKLVVTGHSRYGKAALCAGIHDERFSVVAPTGSGCGGVGSFRFTGGRMGEDIGISETCHVILSLFPEWFSDHLMEFYGEEPEHRKDDVKHLSLDQMKAFLSKDLKDVKGKKFDECYMPFDMHFARALIAPRAIISSDGLSDTWANPYGTQVNFFAAEEVFEFLNVPMNNAMYFREGGHSYNEMDWEAVMDYCDFIFFHKKPKASLVMKDEPGFELYDLKVHYSWTCPQK